MIHLYDRNRSFITTLENAYNVSYNLQSEEVWEMSFNLPLSDPKSAEIIDGIYKQVELFEADGERVGLFRIQPFSVTVDDERRVVSCIAYGTIITLIDSVVFGEYIREKTAVLTIVQDLLDRQKTVDWVVGHVAAVDLIDVDFSDSTGIIDPLFSILELLEDKYVFTYNTLVYPWVLSLEKAPTVPICRVKDGYNLKDLTLEYDPSSMVNRVYPVGQNEDGERVTIPGLYVENADSVAKYGPIEVIITDQEIDDPIKLSEMGSKYLEESKDPTITWSIGASDLVRIADPIPSAPYLVDGLQETLPAKLTVDRLRLNQMVMVEVDGVGDVELVIKGVSKGDVFGAPNEITLDLDNGKKNQPYSMIGVQKSINDIRDRIYSNVYSIIARGREIATEIINSGHGGFVRYYPNRILIMDTEEEGTAMNVWQFNLNGIGHSKTGVNGPYEYAWTIDGRFNTDFIDAGAITTHMISNDYGTNLLQGTNRAISDINDEIAEVNIKLGANNLLLSVQSAAGGDVATQSYVQSALDAVNKTNPNRISGIPESWEQGSINLNTGEDNNPPLNEFIRSKAFYPIKAGAVTISMNPAYGGRLIFYDDNYQYVSRMSVWSSLHTLTIPSDYKMRLVLVRKNSDPIRPDDIGYTDLKVENSSEATEWTPYFGDLGENLQNDYFLLVLSSDNGWVVDKDNWSTTLRAHLYWYNEEVTVEHEAYNFGWYRQYPGESRVAVGAGYSLQVSGSTLAKSATYTCEFISTSIINLLTTFAGDTLMTRNNDNIMIIGDY